MEYSGLGTSGMRQFHQEHWPAFLDRLEMLVSTVPVIRAYGVAILDWQMADVIIGKTFVVVYLHCVMRTYKVLRIGILEGSALGWVPIPRAPYFAAAPNIIRIL